MGMLFISIVVLTFGVWLASVSDYFKNFIQLSFFIIWFAISTGAAIYVAVYLRIPNHDYIGAIVALLLGALLYVPWHAFAYPEIKKIIQELKSDITGTIYSKKRFSKNSQIELPKSFAPGTTFADVEGVLVTELSGNCWAFEPGKDSRRFPVSSFDHNGTLLSESEFRSRFKNQANLQK